MKVFVTVGTTSFSDLVNYMLLESTQSTLKRLGYTQLTIQAGKSDINNHLELLGVSIFDYTMDLDRYILESDLVISHAGAGTIFQVLYHRKRLVAVVNESLMDNHQQELVQEMQDYLTPATIADLDQVLLHLRDKKTLEKPDGKKFAQLFQQ